MKTLLKYGLIAIATLLMSGCATKSYVGMVDVVAVGAGPKPTTVDDKQYIQESSLPSIVVGYTPNLTITEQEVSDTVKYVAGDALIKSYTGEPKLLADYLDSYQKLINKVLILDKDGVVAWSGEFSAEYIDNSNDINTVEGIYDYGLTGRDFITFQEAMEKFILDEETTDFDEDKAIKFPRNLKENLASAFSYSKKYPLLFTKLPYMTIESSRGTIDLSKTIGNGKPTVLVFFMSQSKSSKSLEDDIGQAKDILNMARGKSTTAKDPTPEMVLKQLQDDYLTK